MSTLKLNVNGLTRLLLLLAWGNFKVPLGVEAEKTACQASGAISCLP